MENLLDLDGPTDVPAGPAGMVTAAPAAAAAAADDLLNLLDGRPAMTSSAALSTAPPATTGVGDALLDVFDSTPAAHAATPVLQPVQELIAYEKGPLQITMACKKEAGHGAATITASVKNSAETVMTNFLFEAAVPKYVQLLMQPASSAIVAPMPAPPVLQSMTVVNAASGERPLLMKLRIAYTLNGESVQDMAQVANFPAGF
eukprot:NODE_18011_length_915_cov_6.455584.p1 GENE.NODE_18011_length_915_cov_6.455584~~NODE_18011_length_915_cov_6.455584.p1  ORF type:complete len:203 (-),score=65.43 NODE_18011_length_915_cov_6.455584:155-763(-)